MTTIYLALQRGDESYFNTITENTKDATAVYANSTSTIRTGLIRTSQSCNIAVNLTAEGTFTLYTNNTFTSEIGNTTAVNAWTTFGSQLVANQVYGFTYISNLAPTLDDQLFKLQTKNNLTIANWFPNGFSNIIPLGPTVSRTTQTDGSFIYTFTNYPTVANTAIALLQTGSSIQNGTITITSTIPAFANQSEAFTSPAGYIAYIVPTTTGNVSGTVTVTVTGSGTTQFLKTLYTTTN